MGTGASLSLSENDELMMESYKQIRVLFEKLDKAGHGIPNLPDPTTVSKDLHSFIDICFQRNVDMRPSSKQLANHPFVQLDESQIFVQSSANGTGDQLNNTIMRRRKVS